MGFCVLGVGQVLSFRCCTTLASSCSSLRSVVSSRSSPLLRWICLVELSSGKRYFENVKALLYEAQLKIKLLQVSLTAFLHFYLPIAVEKLISGLLAVSETED